VSQVCTIETTGYGAVISSVTNCNHGSLGKCQAIVIHITYGLSACSHGAPTPTLQRSPASETFDPCASWSALSSESRGGASSATPGSLMSVSELIAPGRPMANLSSPESHSPTRVLQSLLDATTPPLDTSASTPASLFSVSAIDFDRDSTASPASPSVSPTRVLQKLLEIPTAHLVEPACPSPRGFISTSGASAKNDHDDAICTGSAAGRELAKDAGQGNAPSAGFCMHAAMQLPRHALEASPDPDAKRLPAIPCKDGCPASHARRYSAATVGPHRVTPSHANASCNILACSTMPVPHGNTASDAGAFTPLLPPALPEGDEQTTPALAVQTSPPSALPEGDNQTTPTLALQTSPLSALPEGEEQSTKAVAAIQTLSTPQLAHVHGQEEHLSREVRALLKERATAEALLAVVRRNILLWLHFAVPY
jgi:hypothetical protein